VTTIVALLQCFRSDPFGIRRRGILAPSPLSRRGFPLPAHPRWVPHFSSRLHSGTMVVDKKSGNSRCHWNWHGFQASLYLLLLRHGLSSLHLDV